MSPILEVWNKIRVPLLSCRRRAAQLAFSIAFSIVLLLTLAVWVAILLVVLIAILLVVLTTWIAVLVVLVMWEQRRQLLLCIGIGISSATGVLIWMGAWGLTLDKDNWLSPEGTIQLALLAAALAAFVTWIYKPSKSGEAQTSEAPDSIASNAQHRRVTLIGRVWILSALFLTVLAMLIPLVNEIRVHPGLEPWWLSSLIQTSPSLLCFWALPV